ncbi:MAG: MBL fold metallo-hydrolase [Bacteroidota bacterium]
MKRTQSFQHGPVQGVGFGYFPFRAPKLMVHAYFVDGLLIDTGQRRMAKEVQAAVGELPVEQMLITHHHEDHTGNLRALRQHFNAPVYASERCLQLMEKPPALSLVQKILFLDRPAARGLTPLEGTLETERYRFQVIPIPGHAPDMIALYEPQQGWLFSADLYVLKRPRYMLREESVAQQIRSMERVLSLDFDQMFCAHNPQLKEGKTKLSAKLQVLKELSAEVIALHEQGYSLRGIRNTLTVKEHWGVRLLSGGLLSAHNIIASIVRDHQVSNSAV